MIAKAVELADATWSSGQEDIQTHLTDGALLRSLVARKDDRIERLVRGVVYRDLLKRAYVLSTGEIGRRAQG